jgi:hypothetical protein
MGSPSQTQTLRMRFTCQETRLRPTASLKCWSWHKWVVRWGWSCKAATCKNDLLMGRPRACLLLCRSVTGHVLQYMCRWHCQLLSAASLLNMHPPAHAALIARTQGIRQVAKSGSAAVILGGDLNCKPEFLESGLIK